MVDMSSELLDINPVVLDDLWMLLLVCWDELRYVVDLGIVEDPRRQFTKAPWLVAVVSSIFEISPIF
jgi:hypothetical protein